MRDLLDTLSRGLVLALACALLLAGGEAARAQTGTAPQTEPPSELWKAFPLDSEQGGAEPIPPSGEAPPSGGGIGLEQPAGPSPSETNPSFPQPILLGVALAAAVLLACAFLTRGGALARLAHELRELGQPGRERLLGAPSSLMSVVAVAPRALGRSVGSASIRVSRTFVAAKRALDGRARSFPASMRPSTEAVGQRTLRPVSALGKSRASRATAARERATSAAKAVASLRREHGRAVLFYSALMLTSCALGVLVAYVLY